jgi:hypothetical protein
MLYIPGSPNVKIMEISKDEKMGLPLRTCFRATRANQNPIPSLQPVITAVGIMSKSLLKKLEMLD